MDIQSNFEALFVDRLVLNLYDYKIRPVSHELHKTFHNILCDSLPTIKNRPQGDLIHYCNMRFQLK